MPLWYLLFYGALHSMTTAAFCSTFFNVMRTLFALELPEPLNRPNFSSVQVSFLVLLKPLPGFTFQKCIAFRTSRNKLCEPLHSRAKLQEWKITWSHRRSDSRRMGKQERGNQNRRGSCYIGDNGINGHAKSLEEKSAIPKSQKCWVWSWDFAMGFCTVDRDLLWPAILVTTHLENLRKIFDRLRKNSFLLQPEKCDFLHTATEYLFLGHRVNSDEIFPDERKFKAVREFPTPKSQQLWQNWLRSSDIFIWRYTANSIRRA